MVFFRDHFGLEIFRLSTTPISGYSINSIHKNGIVELDIESIPLVGGRYSIDIGFVQEKTEWITKIEEVVWFDVYPQDVYGSGFLLNRSRGLIVVNHKWGHREIKP